MVAQHFGFDGSTSALFVAAWSSEAVDTINERTQRLQRTALDLIEAIGERFEQYMVRVTPCLRASSYVA
ncbi:hypothetical protein [Halomarina ordinaria]|uniref:Transposase n=1 Tax=Halomarina ordinaria TaxID=3033939 RepID=A0ABD5UF64_9EURY|nr:hypothetical protein [Halomarina sp. PSRA2]